MGFVRPIIYSLAAISVSFYYYTVMRYSNNIPIADDFDAVLDFMARFNESSSLSDKIALIFLQHNEHRIALTRLTVLANYWLFNNINFKTLIMIGNIGLIGILIVIFLSYNKRDSESNNKRNLLWFIPVVFILFEPQYFGAIFFAMGTIQNFYVLLFAFLSLYFLPREGTKYFVIAAVFAAMSTFTSGNGIMCFFAGMLALFLQKRYKLLIIWSSIILLNAFVYLHGYVQPADHPSMFRTLLNQPGTVAQYFIVLLGNIVYIPHIMDNFDSFSTILYLPMVMGSLLLLFFVYLTINKYYIKNTVIYSFIVFILLSEMLAAAGRSSLGVFNALTTRYIVMSVLLVIFSYIAFLEISADKIIRKYFYIILAAAVSFNIYAFYSNHDKIVMLHKSVKQKFFFFKDYNTGLTYPNEKKAATILRTSINRGYYRIPDIDFK